MKKFLIIIFLCASVAGCQTKLVNSSVSPQLDARASPKTVWQLWNMRISCSASWGNTCGGEASPETEAVIPPGYTHCRTVAQKNSGPANSAGSWWVLDGNRVRVYAAACGGPFYDQYSSWVDVNWITSVIQSSSVNDPENDCSPATSGAADMQVSCF